MLAVAIDSSGYSGKQATKQIGRSRRFTLFTRRFSEVSLSHDNINQPLRHDNHLYHLVSLDKGLDLLIAQC